MRYSSPQVRGAANSGFGIIELMIAMALGIIIMLGVTQIATDNSVIRHELSRSARQIENAAFALREIESDLMSAGFWGEMGEQDLIEDPVNAGEFIYPPICPNEIDSVAPHSPVDDEMWQMLTVPVQGGSGEFDCNTVDATDSDKITPKADTDFIAVRRASSCALGSTGCPAAGGNFHLQVEACFRTDVPDDELPGVAKVIEVIDDVPDFNVFEYQRRDCDTTASLAARAPIYRLINRVYYINDEDELVRAELVGDEYEQTVLVEGIETMRFEYGMDRNGDGQVDDDVNGYTLEPTTDFSVDPPVVDAFPEAWRDVAMVRIYMVVRNLEQSAGYTDTRSYTVAGEDYEVPEEFENHRRQLYVRTVGLRNVAGRRQ